MVNLHPGDEMDQKMYGPYAVKDIFSYLNLTYSLDCLSKSEIEDLGGADFSLEAYSGQLHFSTEGLLSHKVILTYPVLVTAIQALVDRTHTKILAECDLLLILFGYAEEHARLRIFLFCRSARMFYSLMMNATPPREGVAGKTANVNKTITTTEENK